MRIKQQLTQTSLVFFFLPILKFRHHFKLQVLLRGKRYFCSILGSEENKEKEKEDVMGNANLVQIHNPLFKTFVLSKIECVEGIRIFLEF